MERYSTPKKMRKVGDLFEKYKTHFKAPQASVEKAFIDSVEKIIGLKLQPKNVSYTVATRVLNLRISSIVKTEIRFKEREVLEDLVKSLGADVAPKKII